MLRAAQPDHTGGTTSLARLSTSPAIGVGKVRRCMVMVDPVASRNAVDVVVDVSVL